MQHSPPAPDTPPLEDEVIRRLQGLRRDRGYTLQEVYDVTGVHVARLESRKANMTVITLATLCRFYGISLAEFFHGL
jgi:transcriptional regulator with XRE-family HTH domain